MRYTHSREADFCVQSDAIAEQYRQTLFDPVFNEGIDMFDDPNNKIYTPYQETLFELSDEVDLVINQLTEKMNTLSKSKNEKKRIIAKILGSSEEENTLYYLKQQIEKLQRKNGNKLSEQKMIGIVEQYRAIVKKHFLNNRHLSSYANRQGRVYKWRELVSDSVKTLFSQHTLTPDLSTTGMLNALGKHSQRKMNALVKKSR